MFFLLLLLTQATASENTKSIDVKKKPMSVQDELQLENKFKKLLAQDDPTSRLAAIAIVQILSKSSSIKTRADYVYCLGLLYFNYNHGSMQNVYLDQALHAFVKFCNIVGLEDNSKQSRAAKALIRAIFCAHQLKRHNVKQRLIQVFQEHFTNFKCNESEKRFMKASFN